MRAVIKIGGSLANSPEELRTLMQSIEDFSSHHTIVIVPGGGPFADNVRELQGALNASDSSAHWMAILAMEQFGELLSQYTPKLEMFSGREILKMMAKERSFILQPYRLMRTKDELPHTWNVTSDSIAVWVAILVDADLVVLAKSSDKLHDLYRSLGSNDDRPLEIEEIRSLAKNGIVDSHVLTISPHFRGALHVIDGRKEGILDQILKIEERNR